MSYGDNYFCFRDEEILCLENILLYNSKDWIGGFAFVSKAAVQIVVSNDSGSCKTEIAYLQQVTDLIKHVANT